MSAWRPTARLPSRCSSLIARAGFSVDIVTTCGSVKPEPEEARHDLGHAVHGVEPAGHREIGADAVREQALVDDAAADVEAEVHPPVRGVEPHAAVGGLARLRHQLAVGVEHAAGVRR